jgi:DNA-binding transcriptional ArsR family regulator
VVDLAEGRAISRPAVSKHLRVLARAGLVSVEERGRERHYRLDRTALEPVRQLVSELIAPVPPSALDALELEVRRVGRDRRAGLGDGTSATSTTTTITEDTA